MLKTTPYWFKVCKKAIWIASAWSIQPASKVDENTGIKSKAVKKQNRKCMHLFEDVVHTTHLAICL